MPASNNTDTTYAVYMLSKFILYNNQLRKALLIYCHNQIYKLMVKNLFIFIWYQLKYDI